MTDEPDTRRPRVDLTGSQLKSLLMVASDSRLQIPPAAETTLADAEALLADLSRARGDTASGLLQTSADAATPVEELTRIKDLAKVFMKEAQDSPHREAARLLYHAAVATAFVHHDAAISGRALHKQRDLYERFAAAWAGHPLGDLFREAAARVTS